MRGLTSVPWMGVPGGWEFQGDGCSMGIVSRGMSVLGMADGCPWPRGMGVPNTGLAFYYREMSVSWDCSGLAICHVCVVVAKRKQ